MSTLQRIDDLWDEFQCVLEKDPNAQIEDFAATYPDEASMIMDYFPTLEELRKFSANEAANPPKRMLGEYEIGRCIGFGGMGVVYLATTDRLRGEVALKIINQSQANPTTLKRFHREATAASSLHHSNIVPVHELRSDNENCYFTMRFIDGPNLAEVIEWADLRNKLDEENSDLKTHADSDAQLDRVLDQLKSNWHQIAKLGADVASALSHAHDNGVLHRDIKPSNIIVDETGKAWVTDFGIAKLIELSAVTTINPIGTPRYMSPEQLRGLADARSDIFALGLTLYELASMKRMGASECKSTNSGGLAPLSGVDPTIPRELARIIHKAIELDPNNRYQTANEMEQELRRFRLGDKQPSSCSQVRSRWPSPLLMVPLVVVVMVILLTRLFSPLPSTIWIAKDKRGLTLSENQTFVGYVDHDAMGNYDLQIVDEKDGFLFEIDPSSGKLSFKSPPDFESPLDADADNEYQLRVQVTGWPNRKTTFDSVIRVIDIEEPPKAREPNMRVTVRNSSDLDAARIRVSDDQDHRFSGLTFAVSGGADADSVGIRPILGSPYFFRPPNDQTPGDSNGDSRYEVDVVAYDRSFVNVASVRDEHLRLSEVVSKSSLLRTKEILGLEEGSATLGIASSNGRTFFQLCDDHTGTAALWRVTVSPTFAADSNVTRTLVSSDCGLPLTTLGLATADGKTFYVATDSNESVTATFLVATLDTGVFQIVKTHDESGIPKTIRSLSTLDGKTFYYRTPRSIGYQSTSTDCASMLWIGTLSDNGTFRSTAFERFDPCGNLNAEAFWIYRSESSRFCNVHLTIDVKQ